jgi:hypothetical protein
VPQKREKSAGEKKASSLEGSRNFLSSQIPFLIGRNFNRVRPGHVFNGFLEAAFGKGSAEKAVRQLVKPKDDNAKNLLGLALINSVAPNIAEDPNALTKFRRALTVTLNADNAVAPSSGSLFPASLGMISDIPDDDGTGEEVWNLVCANDPNVGNKLESLFKPNNDTLSTLGVVLCGNAEPPVANISSEEPIWKKSKLGKKFANNLASLIAPPLQDGSLFASRSAQMVTLMRGCYMIVLLGTLRTAELVAKPTCSKWEEVSPLFVYGGIPPGDPREATSRLAVRAYADHADHQRKALQKVLESTIQAKYEHPKNTPKSERPLVSLINTFPTLRKKDSGKTKTLKNIIKESVELLGDTTDTKKISDRLLENIYPKGWLDGAYRRYGSMLGMCTPKTGGGKARLLLETPTLGLLTAATVQPDEPREFPEWIDHVYDCFGIILGTGSGNAHDPVTLLKRSDEPGIVEECLRDNQEQLRKRMIRAGLAIEYSDDETMVGPIKTKS